MCEAIAIIGLTAAISQIFKYGVGFCGALTSISTNIRCASHSIQQWDDQLQASLSLLDELETFHGSSDGLIADIISRCKKEAHDINTLLHNLTMVEDDGKLARAKKVMKLTHKKKVVMERLLALSQQSVILHQRSFHKMIKQLEERLHRAMDTTLLNPGGIDISQIPQPGLTDTYPQRGVLHLISALPESIATPAIILIAQLSCCGSDAILACQVTSLDEFGQSAILNFLANRGLIIRGQSPGSLCLEPSASVLVKEELRSLRLFPIYMENFLRLMESNWPRDPEGCDIFQKDSSCIFQAFSTLRVLTELCVEDQISQAGLSIIVSMATRLTRLLTNMGLHVKARHMAQKVLEWGPAIFSSDAAANSAVRRQLAVGERYSGRLQVAARMELEVLKLQTDVLGDSHPETMRSLNNYALTLRSQGKLADAKRAHCIALSTQERILGMNHPDTLISVSNLGQCLQDLGQHVSAESMLRRALSSRQILFTPTHPAILTSMSDLGVSYILQHRYEEAENIHRMCLYNRGMMFGVDHPQTIRSKSNLAITLTHQGRQKSAEILLREVAAKLDALLGSDQPESIKAHQNLARFLRDQNRYQEAEELLRVCSARAEQALGRTHSRTIDIWRELSIIFHHMEKYVEALKFAIRVRGVRVELFGFENSATCDSIRHVEQLQSLL